MCILIVRKHAGSNVNVCNHQLFLLTCLCLVVWTELNLHILQHRTKLFILVCTVRAKIITLQKNVKRCARSSTGPCKCSPWQVRAKRWKHQTPDMSRALFRHSHTGNVLYLSQSFRGKKWSSLMQWQFLEMKHKRNTLYGVRRRFDVCAYQKIVTEVILLHSFYSPKGPI